MYTCGWDGGGTKTTVYLLNPDNTCLTEATFGPLNANGASPERVEATVMDALGFMGAQAGGLDACKGLVIGMAGISNQTLNTRLRSLLKKGGYTGPLSLLGDHEIALAGAIDGPGAILIAGTGSICYGKDGNGMPFRVGGYGYLIDDLGSGYAIGRDILTAVVRAADGRAPATCLTRQVFECPGIADISSLITWLYDPSTGKKEIAGLARLLPDALNANDPAALRIADQAAHDLAELVIPAFTSHGLYTAELALTGSIPVHFPTIREQLISLVHAALPGVTIGTPKRSPAEGAARLAQRLFST